LLSFGTSNTSSDPIDTDTQQLPPPLSSSSSSSPPSSSSSSSQYKTLYEDLLKKNEQSIEMSSLLRLEIERLETDNSSLQRTIVDKDEVIERYQQETSLCHEYIAILEQKLLSINSNTNQSNKDIDSTELLRHAPSSSSLSPGIDLWNPSSLLKKSEAFETLSTPARCTSSSSSPLLAISPEKIAKMATVTISTSQKLRSKKPPKYRSKWNSIGFKI